MPIHFYDYEVHSGLNNRKRLKDFITQLVQLHLPKAQKIEVNYIFCTDSYLLDKNQTFLNHNTYTDILTFDLSETEMELKSEIYISIERVKENAKKFKAPYQQELHRVMFHGLLHLFGFKDHAPADEKEMRHQEQLCLNNYFDTNHE